MSDQDILRKLLESLKNSKINKNGPSCLQTIAEINEFFDSPKSSSEIKYAIELIFKESDRKFDFLKFIVTAIYAKTLHESAAKIFELIQKLVTLYPSFIKSFSKSIIDIGIQCVKYSEPSARFKEMVVKAIDELITKDALDDDIEIDKIIDGLMSVLQQDTKSRLFRGVFELLGKISKKFPDKFTHQNAAKLRDKMVTTLQNLFKDDKASFSFVLISGVVDGLKNHLENFTPKENEDLDFKKRLYECMVQLSDPFKHANNIKVDSNRVAFRNMLSLVQQYGHLVGDYIFEDCKMWDKVLLQWTKSKTYEDKNAGVQATQTVHLEIAKAIEKRKNPNDKAILLFFMQNFQKTLESPQSLPHEIRIAIRGFGSFSAACKVLLEPQYLSNRFDLILQRTEYSYFVGDKKKRREVLEHLPNYIESLSKIMNQLNEISGIQLQSLQSVVVILIKDFHYLSTSHHKLVATGLLETFVNLEKAGGKIFNDVLESVIWQGILWTCSHQLTYDLEENFDNIKDWTDTLTYRNYLPLWKQILSPTDEKYQHIRSSIYEHFIKNLFHIIEKLNLDTKKRKYFDESANNDVEFFFTDPILDLEPVRAENFQILYNLVQFYDDIITNQTNEDLEKNFVEWLEHWLNKSIHYALKYPLISAFMYFIEIALKVIQRLNYITENTDNMRIVEPLRCYIKSLFARSQQISGELQVACLQLIFQTPTIILKHHVNEIISIFIIGFTVGKSILPLTHHTLTCFQNIVNVFSNDPKTRRKLLENVLPYLESYLSSSKEASTESELKMLRYKRQKKRMMIQSIETDLMRMKKRILLFLGQCNPDESQLILSKFEQKLARDYITFIFSVTLNCDDTLAPLIYLDQIIERVSHLALYSSDRSTKVSACELLHGMVLYIMGKNLDRSESLPIWKDLCKNSIILGADKDQTVRSLFEPILMQMMHYYSKPDKILSSLSTTLMESVMEMMSYRDNGIQDLSARLLREFILWLMRQTNQEQRKLSPVTLVDIFYELKKMSIETEQSRRIGATLAFNNIYRIIREEESLINIYWIYLLDVFCINFKSTEDFSDDLDNYFVDYRRFDQISCSLDHLTRVFVERSEIFQQTNSDRIKPDGFKGVTLKDVLNWLFKQCGMKQYFYRRKCMEIFTKILPQYNTNKFYYEENWNVEKILLIGDILTGMKKHPNLLFLVDTHEPIYKETYKWLKNFLTLLDFYQWIFEIGFLPQRDAEKLLTKSIVKTSIEYFLSNVMVNDMNSLVRSIDEGLLNSEQMSMEAKLQNRHLDKIYIMRNIILVRIFDFIEVIMKNHQIEKYFVNIQDEILLKFIKKLIFKPQKLNFDYKSQNIIHDLPQRLVKFISSSAKHSKALSVKLMELMQTKIVKYVNNLCDSCDELLNSKVINEVEENKLKGIDLIITHFKDQMNQVQLKVSARALIEKLFNGIVEESNKILRPKHLTPPVKKFANNIIKMCLKIDYFLQELTTFSFNSELLKVTESCFIRKGENFLSVLKNPIFEVFTLTIQQTVTLFVALLDETDDNRLRIFNILAEMNEFIYKYNTNPKVLDDNVHAMISIWPKIMQTAMVMNNELNCVDLAIINLVTFIAMTCPYELHLLGQRLENFQKWLLALFSNRDNALEIKSKGIFLLPCITHSNDVSNNDLMNALNKIQEYHIPFRSREFPEGSIERSSLVALTKAIFQALLTSKSPIIYRFVINITIIDENYILEEKLQKVQKQLVESLTEKEQEIFLNQTFESFVNDKIDFEIRLTLVSRYLLTLMKNCHVDTMLSFIRQKVGQIWTLTESNFDYDPETAFVNRSGAYMLIEAFAASVPREKILEGMYSFNGNISNGETFVKQFSLKATFVRRDVVFVVENPKLQKLFRKFQCYCYRALATLVSNTKEPSDKGLMKVFNICLFQENPAKRSYIWRKMINVMDENLYSNWSQDFDELPRVKEYIVSVKDINPSDEQTQSRKYISTMAVFDRSLSQTLTKTDLSYSVVISKSRDALENSQLRIEKQHQKTMKINLESMPINNHEIMGILVAVVNSIYTRKISVYANFKKEDREKYEWVISIANSLMYPEQHKNVKIFLAKLIENCRDVFSHYAEFLTEPILRLLTDGCLGESMNFFITDLVTMLLSWSKIYKPTKLEEKEDAASLLKFVMKNAYHERSEIFKMNLELIKKVVETWNDILGGKIPFQILYDMLQKPRDENPNDKKHNEQLICGIQLNAVILANNLTPWDTEEHANFFVKAILSAFYNESPKVYQPASQLMGLCLQIINNDDAVKIVKEKLDKLASKRDKMEIFLQLLYGIQKHYPSILDSFMGTITSSIPSAVRKIKCIYLEMFLARLEIYEQNIYRELFTIRITHLLKQSEYQLLALHIINKAIQYFKVEEFMSLFDEFNYLTRSSNSEIRCLIYEIMIFSVEKFKNVESFDVRKPMKIILSGFNDSDQQIQNRVINFFNENSELSKSFTTRFQELLSSYYDPLLEKEFLHYATQLLLDISVRHPRSNRPLLDYDQRNNINFFEVPIVTRSSTQRSLPPMFIHSQQRQLLAGDGSQYSQIIRATQNSNEHQMFAPTQDPTLITQVSQNLNFKQTQNSLFVSLKPQYLTRRSSFASQADEAEDLQMQIQRNKENPQGDSLDYLRRRILKRNEDQKSKEFALRAIERRDFSEASKSAKINKIKQGKEVVLYRRYRIGDFPDFFFNALAILMPLQALVKKDSIIARHIFISIFSSLVTTFKEIKDEELENRFYESINESVVYVLKNTKESNSYLLAVLVEMSMKSGKYLEISPNFLKSSLSITGILFLESQINRCNQNNNDENQVKRIRLDVDDIQRQHWIKLVDFYYKNNDFDVVNGILTEKLNLNVDVKLLLLRAIDCESNNKFDDAMELYSKLLTKNAARNEQEKDLFYNSYFNCLANLSSWDVIVQTVQKQFDGYEEVWNENIPIYQNTFLPMLLKGELRQILNDKVNVGFLNIIEDWLIDEKKSEYLHKKFPEEIAMLNVYEENYAACCVEMDKTLQSLSYEWSYLETFENKLRLLKATRNLAEITNFTYLMTSSSPSVFESQLEKLILSWRTSQPKSSDELTLWSDLIAYRKSFIILLTSKFPIADEKRQLCESYLIDMERNMLDIAFSQKNYDSARFLVSKLKEDLKDSTNENKLKYNLAFGKHLKNIGEQKSQVNFEQAMRRYGNAWESLKTGVLTEESVKEHVELEIEALSITSEISWNIFKLYQKLEHENVEEKYNKSFKELMDVIDMNSNVMDDFLRYGERALKGARNLAQKYVNDDYSPEKELLLGDIYFRLGKFYRDVFVNKIDESQAIQLEMTKAMFRAISYGKDARVYIPYILQLPKLKSNELTNEFNEQLDMVPEWMFVSYISQILSSFDFESECYLDKLILKIAKKYPNALHFPFKLSRDNFLHIHENQIMEKPLVREINELVSTRIANKFTSAIQCLVIPEKLIDTHYQIFRDHIESNIDNEKYQIAVQDFYDKVFKDNSDLKGVDFSRIRKTFHDKILELKEFNFDTQKDAALKKIHQLESKIMSASRRREKDIELRKLCSWLSEYKWSGDLDFIEIPGQYTGDEKPFIENHVKIVRFEQRLKVYHSKQLPIGLTILGSDGKSYNFIIKYGEDLRQDQRIQQVMKLMSDKLSLDKKCAQNRLKIDTYQVVPINSCCGMLQTVINSSTISEFMQDISEQFISQGFNALITTIRHKMRDFLLGDSLFSNWTIMYENAVLQLDRTVLEEKFEELSNQIPKDILQYSLRQISLTLETYFILRKNFITSLSAMSIAHWLLSIGDRHLGNILMNMTNGKLIAIDFGIAFGSAATLGVPELIPFRLTPHFVSVLEPNGINGMIKQNMINTLRCLRDHEETILICLEVFINEPTLDWLRQSKMKSFGRDVSDKVENQAWNPKSRVDIVRRKLEGGSPAKLLIEELSSGHIKSKKPLLKAYENMINGEENSTRQKLHDQVENLTVEDQVSCIIELATDKALLATTYIGWDSFF